MFRQNEKYLKIFLYNIMSREFHHAFATTPTAPAGSAACEVERHISNALAGLFSLGGKNDVAVVENLIKFDDCFDDLRQRLPFKQAE